MIDHEAHLPMVKAMIRRFASFFPGFDREELESRAYYEYARAVQKYDPQREAKFSTFLYRVLHNNLTTFITRTLLKSARFDVLSLDDIEYSYSCNDARASAAPPSCDAYNPERICAISDLFFSDLSNDAQEILLIIFSSPSEIFNTAKNLSPKNLRGALISMLRDRSWAWSRIWSSMSELKTLVREEC